MRRNSIFATGLTTAVVGAVLFAPTAFATEDGEVWVPAQDTGRVFVVHGMGSVETITAPGLIINPHLVNFAPSGEYAYVSDVANGRLNIVRADDRQVVGGITSAQFGGGNDTHQAKPSPDGTVLLVARRFGSQTLFKVHADEAAESWTVDADKLNFAPLGKTPICTVFRPDGERAYVSLGPNGVAVVDVDTMDLVTSAGGGDGILDTEGAVACGMAPSKDGSTVFVTSNGGTITTPVGRLYRLNTATDTLTLDRNVPGTDIHFLDLSPNDKTAYATARGSEALKVIDLTGTAIGTVGLDATPSALNDQPDGVATKGNNVYVALKNSGKLAVVRGTQGTVTYLDLAAPSSNALPHVVVRP